MSIIYHERPGVYSDYTVSRIQGGNAEKKTIAVLGTAPSARAGLYTVTSRVDAVDAFGADSGLGRMLTAAYQNGAGTVLAYCVENGNYTAAIEAVLALKKAAYCCMESVLLDDQTALRDALISAAGQKGECIGVVGMSLPTKAQLLERAAALDSERMVLVGPDVYDDDGTAVGGCIAAAALCGLLAAQTDPALPLNGAVLAGFGGVSQTYEDTDVDALVQGGVTVLEAFSGSVTVLRGITSRQTVGEGRDTTWRELNTILIADDVIPGIRSTLAAQFSRAKNNAATRNAIGTAVALELENRLRREIIEGYDDLSVTASEQGGGICQVSFSFAVVHGLNQIHLTANIQV